jgi:hypothetical protein
VPSKGRSVLLGGASVTVLDDLLTTFFFLFLQKGVMILGVESHLSR